MATSHSSLTATYAALTPPARVTVFAVLGISLLNIFQQIVLVGSLFPPIGLIQLVPSIIVLITFAARWRWAPLLAAIFAVVGSATNFGYIVGDLSHPQQDPLNFVWTLLVVICSVAIAVSGIAATMQRRG